MIGESNRVMLKGGLSPLRWTRTTISDPVTLNLASAGQSGKKMTGSSKIFSSLPPKVRKHQKVHYLRTVVKKLLNLDTILNVLPRCQKNYPVDFDYELKVGDVRYKHLT